MIVWYRDKLYIGALKVSNDSNVKYKPKHYFLIKQNPLVLMKKPIFSFLYQVLCLRVLQISFSGYDSSVVYAPFREAELCVNGKHLDEK